MAEPIGDFADTNKTKAEPQKAGLPNPFEGASKITFIGELPPEEIPAPYAGCVAFAFETTFPEPEEPASCNEFPPQKKEPVRVAFTYEDLPRVFALSTPHNLTTAQFVVPHDHALTFFELLFRAAEDPAFTEDERQLFRAILNKFHAMLNEQAPGTIAMLEVSVTDPEGKGVPPIADFLIPKPKDYQPDVQPDNTNPVFTYVGRAVIAGSAEPVHLWEFPGYGGKYSLAGGIGVTTAALFSALCDQSITTLEAATDEAKAGLIELLTTTASIPTLFYLDSSESGHDYTPTVPERVFVRQVITALKQAAVPVRLNIQALRKGSKIPEPPDAFADGSARVPNNPITRVTFGALYAGGPKARHLIGGWKEDDGGRPIYEHLGSKGGVIHAYPDPRTGELDTEALWGQVAKYDPFTADVALALFAQMTEGQGDATKHPMLTPVTVTADRIADYKGFKRYGFERTIFREKVADSMRLLADMKFHVHRWPGSDPDKGGKWNSEGVTWETRLFDVERVYSGQQTLFKEASRPVIGWSVRAGHWAYHFLNAAGRVWISKISRVLIELDHRENRPAFLLAKKVGELISFLPSFADPKKRKSIRYTIQVLLQDIGELPDEEHRPHHWAGQTLEAFNSAVQTLIESKIFLRVDWPEGFAPGSADRAKGWLEKWLNSTITFYPPDAPPELAAKPKRTKISKKLPKAKPDQWGAKDGEELRRFRAERNIHQADLAEELGVARPYLSQIESGRRVPSAKLQKAIQKWKKEQADRSEG